MSIDTREELKSLIQHLDAAAVLLARNARSSPGLSSTARAFRRLSLLARRPFRLAILGEANSGKSTVANLIAGEMALPALPVANTRLPTLLHYAPAPRVEALLSDGRRVAPGQLSALSLDNIVRLEVGLPNNELSRVEVLDFPGGANPFFRTDLLAVLSHRIDAAIWATVATQAWRETERLAWTGLPLRIRRRGLLAVTNCDLLSGEDDRERLRSRLADVEGEYFSAMCFVAATPTQPAAAADLLAEVRKLAAGFETERLAKALVLTRRLAAKADGRLASEAAAAA